MTPVNDVIHRLKHLLAATAIAAAVVPGHGATVIRHARVFTGDAVIDGATVMIRDGRIEAVTAAGNNAMGFVAGERWDALWCPNMDRNAVPISAGRPRALRAR